MLDLYSRLEKCSLFGNLVLSFEWRLRIWFLHERMRSCWVYILRWNFNVYLFLFYNNGAFMNVMRGTGIYMDRGALAITRRA